jgi:hypothetical protein
MKQILPLVVISILVLGGLGAVAVPEEHNTPEPLLQEPQLEVLIEGGFLRYIVTVTNVGDETFNGTLNFSINTDAWVMFSGDKIMPPTFELVLDPTESFITKWGAVIGFGPANVSVNGVVEDLDYWKIEFETKTTGFILLFFVIVGFEPIILPDIP